MQNTVLSAMNKHSRFHIDPEEMEDMFLKWLGAHEEYTNEIRSSVSKLRRVTMWPFVLRTVKFSVL